MADEAKATQVKCPLCGLNVPVPQQVPKSPPTRQRAPPATPPAAAPHDLDRIDRAASALYTPVRRPNRWALPAAIGATVVVLLFLVLLFASGPKRATTRAPRPAPAGNAPPTPADAGPAPVGTPQAPASSTRSAPRPAASTQAPRRPRAEEEYRSGPRFAALDVTESEHVSRIASALFQNALRDNPAGVRRIAYGTRMKALVQGVRYEAAAMSQIEVSVTSDGHVSASNWHILTTKPWPLAGRYGLPEQTHIFCRNGALAVADWAT